MFESFKKHWQSLQSREQKILLYGGLCIAAILVYSLLWQPWRTALSALEANVQGERQSLTWLQQHAELIKKGGAIDAPAPTKGADQSLLSVLEQTARALKVRQSIKQLTPGESLATGQSETVQVVLEQADFNGWVRWIDILFNQYGVEIEQFSADREKGKPNVAEIRVVFSR